MKRTTMITVAFGLVIDPDKSDMINPFLESRIERLNIGGVDIRAILLPLANLWYAAKNPDVVPALINKREYQDKVWEVVKQIGNEAYGAVVCSFFNYASNLGRANGEPVNTYLLYVEYCQIMQYVYGIEVFKEVKGLNEQVFGYVDS